MVADTDRATSTTGRAGDRAAGSELPILGAISAAHLVSHLHILVLPVLFPFLKDRLGVGYVELGLGVTLFNLVSGFTQAPMGFLVDRLGARKVLIAGLCLGSTAFLLLGLWITYPMLIATALLAGLANCVYHPADYAILNARMSERRMGRAFSVHTFAGYLGGAITPGLMLLAIYWLGGLQAALMLAALVGFAAAAIVAVAAGGPATRGSTTAKAGAAAGPASTPAPVSVGQVLTPAILLLVAFFALLSLSNGGIQNFGVAALTTGFSVDLTAANMALSAFLFASAAGVLAGGQIADRTTRHGSVAALAFAGTALLVAAIPLLRPQGLALVALLGVAGFLSGSIAPSRDMLVRKAAPPGAAGRVFGIVSTGFNIGGIIAPLLYGGILDAGGPAWVFVVSALFMLLTVALVLVSDRVPGRRAKPGEPGPRVGEAGQTRGV